MKRERVLAVLATPLTSVLTVSAHDLYKPDWRGLDGSTYQRWTFDTNDNPPAPIIEITGGAYLLETPIEALIEDLGIGGWYLHLSKLRIDPNPTAERLVLTSDPAWGAVINQIVIDTICIPEPVSLAVMGFGALFVLVRKRR